MADEPETTQTDTATAEQTEAASSQQQDGATAAPKPHPLEPGGERWNEIYRERSEFKREAAALRQQLIELQQSRPQQSETRQFTAAQLQAEVDAGRITPAVMAHQLAWQEKERGKHELRQEFQQEQIRNAALTEVMEFIEKIPALGDDNSPEFRAVAQEAYRIAAERGLPVTDPRVQRQALRETYGPLKRVVKAGEAREFSRRNAETFGETGGGGGQATRTPDPLKGIPKDQIDHWKARGRTPAEMAELAKYYRPSRRMTVG